MARAAYSASSFAQTRRGVAESDLICTVEVLQDKLENLRWEHFEAGG